MTNEEFLNNWVIDPINAKKVFYSYKTLLEKDGKMDTSVKLRPGVSYSLRAKHPAQKNRDLFVMVDIVDDDPQNRWLSVCFYADLVTDPEELGDYVPQGLLGEDAICFNYDEEDPHMATYLEERITEAMEKAGQQ